MSCSDDVIGWGLRCARGRCTRTGRAAPPVPSSASWPASPQPLYGPNVSSLKHSKVAWTPGGIHR
jgi:hypothetical protein